MLNQRFRRTTNCQLKFLFSHLKQGETNAFDPPIVTRHRGSLGVSVILPYQIFLRSTRRSIQFFTQGTLWCTVSDFVFIISCNARRSLEIIPFVEHIQEDLFFLRLEISKFSNFCFCEFEISHRIRF